VGQKKWVKISFSLKKIT